MAYRNPTPTVDVVVHRIHNDQLEVLLLKGPILLMAKPYQVGL